MCDIVVLNVEVLGVGEIFIATPNTVARRKKKQQ